VSVLGVIRWWRWLFIAHAVFVFGLTALFELLTLATPPEDGVNIGAAFLAGPLLPLGLPWSRPFIDAPYQFDGLPFLRWDLVAFGPAMLNVILHGVVLGAVSLLWRRRASAGPRSAG
jgi:hypothetical protein